MSSAVRTLQTQWQVFLLALGFFTRIPIPAGVPFDAGRLNQASRYFPLVGVLVGLVGALVLWLASLALPPGVAVLLSMVATVLLTGAFHEDGLADICDGFGGGWTVERKLEIMKDSRVGAYGVVGIVLALLLKFQLLSELAVGSGHSGQTGQGGILLCMSALVVAHSLSRAVAASFIFTEPYVRDTDSSKVKPLASEQSPSSFAICLLLGLLPLFLLLSVTQALQCLAVVLLTRQALVWLFRRQIGGYTGDGLGAVQQISEIAVYMALAATVSVG